MILDTDTMGATERFQKVINHEEPDRIPIYLMGVHPYSKCYIELMEKEEEILDEWTENDENILITPFGDKTVRYFFGEEVLTLGLGITSGFTTKEIDDQGNIIGDMDHSRRNEKIEKAKAQGIVKGEGQGIGYKTVGYEGRISGTTVLPNGHEYSWYIDGFLKKSEDIKKWFDTYGWPHEKPTSDIDVNEYKKFQSEFGKKMVLVPQISGQQLYESLWPMMGQARFGYLCRKDPDLIHKLIASRKDAQLNILDKIEKLKPIAVFGGDDMGQKGRSLLSPPMFDKFFAKPYKEIFDRIHEMGAIAFNHSCGNITDILPNLIEVGLDGWQSLEPDSMIDHAALKKKYGDKFLFVGGINQSYLTEPNVGPKQVEQHVKEQIKKMGNGGGYVAGPSHDYLNVPLENAIALRDAIYKWGKYPLNYK